MGRVLDGSPLAMDALVSPIELRPMVSRGRMHTLLTTVMAMASAGWLAAWLRLLTADHDVLATSSYGAAWGITVANIIHVIGISHVGIAVSATVRVLKLHAYRNVARIAEIMTLVALTTAVLNIAIDVGRPDRFIIQTLLHGRWHAPMVWSMTVIGAYLVASAVYLYLVLRRDFAALARSGVEPRSLYGTLALGYVDVPTERQRHERTLFWLALALVPTMVSVHSVYGLFFGLLVARSGWFNPLQAPYFVLAAIVSGFSALVVVAALVRRAYHWQEVLNDRIFRTFGAFLAFVVFLYLYFLFSEHLTAQYAGPAGDRAVSDALLSGAFSRTFWLTTILGLGVPFVALFVMSLRRSTAVGGIAVAALVVNVAMWVKRFLLVVPPQFQPHLPPPRPLVAYAPSGIELAVTLGSYAFAALVFVLLIRVVPLVALKQDFEPPSTQMRSRAARRIAMVSGALAVGLMLIVWGIVTRDGDFAPVKWMTGIALLAAVPFLNCVVGDEVVPVHVTVEEEGTR